MTFPLMFDVAYHKQHRSGDRPGGAGSAAIPGEPGGGDEARTALDSRINRRNDPATTRPARQQREGTRSCQTEANFPD
jgi:hypothetical protein